MADEDDVPTISEYFFEGLGTRIIELKWGDGTQLAWLLEWDEDGDPQ